MLSEGLYPLIWGQCKWHSLYSIAFNYPLIPTDDNKQQYFQYFESIKNILPCCICRQHYAQHISKNPTKLTFECFNNRESLTKWLYNLHCIINSELGFEYRITYQDVCNKYASYIAKDDFTLEQKTNAFRNYYDNHAPYVRLELLKCFIKYANERGLSDFESNIDKYSRMNTNSNEWFERNQKCQELIKHMRINGLLSIEDNGKYENLPTIDELNLMALTSTTICEGKLKQMIKLLGYKMKFVLIQDEIKK